MGTSKYGALTSYLQDFPGEKCTLSFKEIENIIGSKLPASVFDHAPEWWSNGNQNYALHWLRADFIVTQYDSRREYAVFTRNKDLAEDYISRCNKQTSQRGYRYKAPSCRVCTPMTSCEDLIAASERYFDEIRKDEHARYLSWEHCYGFFQKNRLNPSDEQLDLLCLHLAWYLASWGMLRGGSFLLWKDYLFHMPVVKLLTSKANADLFSLSPTDLSDYRVVQKIGRLANEITELYRTETSNDDSGERLASDTLVTKILLGTVGCTPAYDRYFKDGIKRCGVAQQRFGETSLWQLGKFYCDNLSEFEKYRLKISQGRIEYPPMKIIDMCFWQMGFDADKKSLSYE